VQLSAAEERNGKIFIVVNPVGKIEVEMWMTLSEEDFTAAFPSTDCQVVRKFS